MPDAIDPDRTVDEVPSDPLDAALAAAFGAGSGPPLPAAGSVVQALGAAPIQLRDPATEPAGPVVKPHSDALPAEAPARLQIHGEIARGGMGAVLKGRDTDLGRDVAVKVLLEAHQGRTELVQRFVEEAQVAGQLQHPGVVPVYEMGQFPDKRPYFTMKLVKGQTLAKLLAERKDPSEDRPRLLGIFLQVCQALAYAHARGVIHRDLKPSNVMVGAFGEVQVMDWGLAKVLKQGSVADEKTPEPAEATVIRTARSGSATAGQPGSQTQAGQVMGTPAYMAPEQARGEAGRLDERCDVFGLGALLCQVLTGQPPYTGGNAEQDYAQAARADLADAFGRLDGCGADAELIALARRCLCADPAGRPRDAGALATELTTYLGSVEARLRRAELERAAAETRAAEERKRRRVQLALAAAILALVVVGTGGGLMVQRQAARREAEQRQAIGIALEKAAGLRQQTRWQEARAVLEEARRVLGEAGPDDLRQRLEVAQAELTLVTRLDDIRQGHAITVRGYFDRYRAEFAYFVAFAEAGLLGDHVAVTTREGQTIVSIDGRETVVNTQTSHYLLPSVMHTEWLRVGDEAAVAARIRASGVSGPLVAALDDWALCAKERQAQSWLLEVARRAAPDPWGDRFRDPAVWQNRQALQGLADDALRGDEAKLNELSPGVAKPLRLPSWLRDDGAKLKGLSPQVLVALGGLLKRAGADPVPLLRAAVRRHPNDFWLNFEVGNALRDAGQGDEAVGYFRVAVALRPNASAAHNNLGNSLYREKNLDGAIAAFRMAIAIDGWHYNACMNLGLALGAKGDLDGAIAAFRQTIAISPTYAVAHYLLGGVLLKRGHFVEARTATQRCLKLLPESDPIRQIASQQLQRIASQQLQRCERLASLEESLPALLSGRVESANAAERADFAWACRSRSLPTRAAKLYAEAFAADPKLADDLEESHRYEAAASAALAAAGQGEDAKRLPDKVVVMLRRQALQWLRADLVLRSQMANPDDPAVKQTVRSKLLYWQLDADLVSVRDKEALDRLPDDEREAWRVLWADVDALLKKVPEKPK